MLTCLEKNNINNSWKFLVNVFIFWTTKKLLKLLYVIPSDLVQMATQRHRNINFKQL